MKTCSACGTEKPLADFGMDRGTRRSKCRVCIRSYLAGYRNRNPDKAATHARAWRARHPDRARAGKSAWREANPDAARAGYLRDTARRRARIRAALVEDFTLSDLLISWEARGLAGCSYCPDGKFEHVDHVIPLARGGSHALSNLVPACANCNKSKGAKLLEEWFPTHQARVAAASASA